MTTSELPVQLNFVNSRFVLSRESTVLENSCTCDFWGWGESSSLSGENWNDGFRSKSALAFEMKNSGVRVLFVFFRGVEKFFRIQNGNLDGIRMLQDCSEIISVMVQVPRGCLIVSSSGYESRVFSNATNTFFLDGKKVQNMTIFQKRERDQDFLSITKGPLQVPFNLNTPPGIWVPGQKWTPLPRNDSLVQNLFLVSEGREVFSKDMEFISFFGQHCIVTRHGLSNLYSIIDGFKSPIWFSEVQAINENGYKISITKKAERVFFVIGKKYVWIERNSPFSLFNSGVFK